MKQKSKPVLLAMTVCDQIIREEGTKKISLMGLFNTMHAKKFPCIHPRMHIYIALTEYTGSANCELKFSDSSGKAIVQLTGPVNFPDKLAVVEMNFCINNLPLPKAGLYHFDFIMDGQPIGHRKFMVQQIKEK